MAQKHSAKKSKPKQSSPDKNNHQAKTPSRHEAKPAEKKPDGKRQAKKEGGKEDMQLAIVRKLMALGKGRGYITYDELNAVLPAEEFSPEVIDAAISALSQVDINVVEEGTPLDPA